MVNGIHTIYKKAINNNFSKEQIKVHVSLKNAKEILTQLHAHPENSPAAQQLMDVVLPIEEPEDYGDNYNYDDCEAPLLTY
ncbi:hypothetical protein C0995_006107 [Termitomyces sp. Mi166|nr:hypothetical protein C0995_006107 [Termitomyces sp. Mi166\